LSSIHRWTPARRPLFHQPEKDAYCDVHQAVFRQIAEEVSTVINKSRLFQELVDSNQSLVRQGEHLNVVANRDALTGVLNRRAIMVALEGQIRAARAFGKTFGVIMADIDNFKKINDTYGHAAGDMALRAFTRRLSAILRQTDYLGRYGGEEFLLLIGDTNQEQLMQFANRFRLVIAETPFNLGAASQTITASFDLALATDSVIPVETLIETADRAVYAAKTGGRNRCELA
jgi:diguanylate cyclase (GGDEF)-like protein